MKKHSSPFNYSFIHLTGFIKLYINGRDITLTGSSFKHINGGDINATSSSRVTLVATHHETGNVVELLVLDDTITVISPSLDTVIENKLEFN